MTAPGVWLLTTVGRSTVDAVVQACRDAGMTAQLEVVVDTTRGGIGPLMQDCFGRHPDAAFYGWLADDTYPRTKGWDVKLAEAAGDWRLSYADDGGMVGVTELRDGRSFSSGLCWGGELVRAVGWWALPGLTAAWIDVAWSQVVAPLRLHAYTPSVLVEHRHWRNDGRDRDEADDQSFATIEATRAVYRRWLIHTRHRTVRRILSRIPRDYLERAVMETVEGRF